jgi:hypothetical protein
MTARGAPALNAARPAPTGAGPHAPFGARWCAPRCVCGRGRLRRPGEGGESLIELLVTIAIVATCVVGLVSALGANFVFSSTSSTATTTHALLVRYAETLAGESYQSCVVNGPTPYTAAAIADIPNTNLGGLNVGKPGAVGTTRLDVAMSIQSVGYWNGDNAPATFTTTCPNSDRGFQQLTLLAHVGDGSYDETVTIFKRLP